MSVDDSVYEAALARITELEEENEMLRESLREAKATFGIDEEPDLDE